MIYYMQTLGKKERILHTWNIKEKGVEISAHLDTWILVKEYQNSVCKEYLNILALQTISARYH